MTTFLPIVVQCPQCKTIFKSLDLGLLGHQGTDECGCQKFWGINPMPHFIRICPECKLIETASSFSRINPSNKEKVLKEPDKSCDTFIEFAQILEQEGFIKSAILAHYNAGCCYRVEKKDKFKTCFREAVRLLKNLYENEGDIDLQGVKISNLIEYLSKCS